MKNKKAAPIVWILLLFCSPLARALSGEELYRYCADNACGGYFIGAFDGLRIAGAIGDEKQRKRAEICAPDTIDDEQIVQIAIDYLAQHPDARQLSAANLALRAWRQQWPCAH